MVHLYGSFQGSFTPNATMDLSVDCGSHCEEYGAPPGERPGETTTVDFCEMSMIEQPLGGEEKRNVTCPPQEGYALISSEGYVIPMFFSTPVSFSSIFPYRSLGSMVADKSRAGTTSRSMPRLPRAREFIVSRLRFVCDGKTRTGISIIPPALGMIVDGRGKEGMMPLSHTIRYNMLLL